MEYNGEVSPGDQSFQQSDAENISSGTSFDGSKQTADGIVNKKLSKPILKKCKAGKRKITVKWKKISLADGYQIQYAMKRNFKKKDYDN